MALVKYLTGTVAKWKAKTLKEKILYHGTVGYVIDDNKTILYSVVGNGKDSIFDLPRNYQVGESGNGGTSTSGTGATLASELIVMPSVNGSINAQAVFTDHETRIDTLEGSSTGTTNRIPKFTSPNSLGDSGLIQVGSNIGMGSAVVPGELFHIGDGNILLEGGGEVAQKFKRDFSTTGENLGVPTGSGVSVNPIFQVGRIIQAGDGDPEIRIMYSDDNTSERTVFEVDRKGIAASVKTSVGSHFEGFASLTDVNPKFRLNSYPRMRLEMGAGGNDITDVAVERGATGGLDFFTNSVYRGGFDSSGNLNLLNTPTAPTAPLGTNTTQIATTAFVLANAQNPLVAEQLTYGRVNVSTDLTGVVFTNANNGVKIPFNNTKYSSGITFTGTDVMTPSVTGRYRVSWLMQAGSSEFAGNGYFCVIQNNVFIDRVFYDMMEAAGVNQCTGFIDVDLLSGLPVELRYQAQGTSDTIAWQAGSYFQIDQLPTAVVVSGDIPVTDNTSSGYFDIGNMRQQWGIHNDGNVDTTTVTMSASFTNTNYVVTITSNNGIAGSVSVENKTTTSFDIDRASTTTSTNDWGWIAIGQKP